MTLSYFLKRVDSWKANTFYVYRLLIKIYKWMTQRAFLTNIWCAPSKNVPLNTWHHNKKRITKKDSFVECFASRSWKIDKYLYNIFVFFQYLCNLLVDFLQICSVAGYSVGDDTICSINDQTETKKNMSSQKCTYMILSCVKHHKSLLMFHHRYLTKLRMLQFYKKRRTIRDQRFQKIML